jgi:pentapeptide MXKDX repeat protein
LKIPKATGGERILAGLPTDFLSSDSSDVSRSKSGAAASKQFAAPHTGFRKGLWQPSLTAIRPTPMLPGFLLSRQKRRSRVRYKAKIGRIAGNKRPTGCVGRRAAEVASTNCLKQGRAPMNTCSRITLGVSAALVSFSLALAPAFAEDKMMKGDSMKKEDSMSKGAMKKDEGMMKKDGMKNNATSDGMKKDDAMKKN